ncbi:MAG: tRNA preQ1(34) S-adenosylmethionine ribosyltransferase-isomerase QueA, partial [Candidatus Omnitrophica bacterium CG11_big_fil_rev_8_21_14_0_20_64_10]
MLAYDLPRELIAREPVAPRDAARLLLLKRALSGDSPRSGTVPSADLAHHTFRDLPGLLRAGDLLVFNDTRVVPARLRGRKAGTGGQVELLLLEGSAGRYRCLGKPGRRLRPGTRLLFNHGSLEAEVLSSDGEEKVIRFLGEEVSEQLARLGEMPLPPYIDRPVAPEDADWYQTVFARSPGAVAAPTAGLHFTGELLERLRAAGIRVAFLTLHV